ETSDVMTAADRDGGHAVLPGARGGEIERAANQPWAGQPLAVPGDSGGKIREDPRFAGARHPAAFDFVEVRREQREAVRVVAEQVSFDEHLGDVPRLRRLESGPEQQGVGVGDQRGGGKARRHATNLRHSPRRRRARKSPAVEREAARLVHGPDPTTHGGQCAPSPGARTVWRNRGRRRTRHPARATLRCGMTPARVALAPSRSFACRQEALVAALLLAGAATLAYHNSFAVPFVFDDEQSIPLNPTLGSLARAWWPPMANGLTVSGRPLLNFSLAVNHALGGTAPAGYHVLNLLIHCAAGFFLFDLVRRTLRGPRLAARFGADAF